MYLGDQELLDTLSLIITSPKVVLIDVKYEHLNFWYFAHKVYEGTSWILEILDWFQKVFHLLSMANAPNSFQNFKNASGMTHFNRSSCFEYALIWMLRNCDIYNSGGIVKKEL